MNERTPEGPVDAPALPARVLGMSLALCLLAGCAAAPATGPTLPPSDSQTLPPAATVSPVPSAAVQTSAPGTPAEAQPPLAQLVVADGSGVAGRLGSWCYGDACADIVPGPAELQPRVVLAGPATELSVELPPPERFVYWRASYRAADDEPSDMTILGEGGSRNPDPDVVEPPEATPLPEFSSATFTAPPSGEWLLEIRVQFPEGRGDVPYYWYAVVP